MMYRWLIIVLSGFVLFCVSGKMSSAEEKSYYQAAAELAELTFNKSDYHDNAIKYKLSAIRSRYANNPATKPYSFILINVVMEVMEMYVSDPDTQTKVKNLSAQLYMREFTEPELREIVKFYRGKAGQKALLKLPILIQKQGELVGQLQLPAKYDQMIIDKITDLQKQGQLPREFK
jgi:hypothetical protein